MITHPFDVVLNHQNKFPKSNGRPVFEEYILIDWGGWKFCFFTSCSCFSYLFLNSLTVISLMIGRCLLKWRTAAAFPCSEAYFPTAYLLASVHFAYFEALLIAASCSVAKTTGPSSVQCFGLSYFPKRFC